MRRRVKSGLTVLAYFTAVGLMFFVYRYLEYVANREAVSLLEPFINEVLTGAWMAALLFPLVARFARRFPIGRFNWTVRLALHACGPAVERRERDPPRRTRGREHTGTHSRSRARPA